MILFFGPPGSGKSVQGKLLVERNGWQWVSTGELFRASQDPAVLERLASGGLVDDDMTNGVLASALRHIDTKSNIILDGYPRNQHQAEWLGEHLSDFGRTIDCVVLFEVPRDELMRRLMGRGRAEDTPEVVAHRLDIYQEKTQPVIDYYKASQTPILVIDGSGTLQDIHERIQAAVLPCLQRA